MVDVGFEFECYEIFVIVGRCLVFRGHTLRGEARVGDRLLLAGSKGTVSATIRVIEHNRKLVPSTIVGEEMGIGLFQFSDPQVNCLIDPPQDTDYETYPPPRDYQELLGVSYPTRLVRDR